MVMAFSGRKSRQNLQVPQPVGSLQIHWLDLIDVPFVSFPFRNPRGVATFGASTGNPNPGTAAITTWSALLLAIEGEVAELNNRLIPLSIRRRRESPAWQDPFEFADSSGSRLNWPAGSFRPSHPDHCIGRSRQIVRESPPLSFPSNLSGSLAGQLEFPFAVGRFYLSASLSSVKATADRPYRSSVPVSQFVRLIRPSAGTFIFNPPVQLIDPATGISVCNGPALLTSQFYHPFQPVLLGPTDISVHHPNPVLPASSLRVNLP
ncbi:hypothetical protein DAPPUDRAFT_275510 [Daphnia pulex]|uniref:Uncharacterized protein n=1 Tax=Daphnia pulex TaxID=6669 RepID=E9I5E7_DAPPU|nr:hypothetical protein DAPPUDRAFT_275510 [Daphnia pulex]|eukprot:EFX60783.1 hypothetical protein DAPPUDRAFT_275510 [Daphnia pulex]